MPAAPDIRIDPAAARPSRRPRRRLLMRWMRRLLGLLVVVALLPVLLVPAYIVVPPVSTLMLEDLATLRGYERDYVTLDAIAPALVQAVVMSEDGRFCEHGGVDWTALDEVLGQEGGPSRGASTIAMQTVKNLFLWSSRSYLRKAVEIPLALYADVVWSKRRTIEIYLNIAEWGVGLYGAEAAAQHYFGKPASELTRREAALLATALPAPRDRNPGNPGPGHSRLADAIERRARDAGPYTACILAGEGA
jgi:monofunctional biosynthetic peptidoglycan transglycosylase